MKKVILLASGVVVMSLMSFATNNDKGIVEINGNTVTIKDTRKISEKDLKFLSENIVGWTYCKQWSRSAECNTMAETFPDNATGKAEIKEILAKYQ